MRRSLLGLLTIVALLGLPGVSAAQLIAGFNFTGTTTPASLSATTVNANLTTANLTRGAGAPASAGSNSFRTTGFQNNGISTANTDYFQVTLQAAAGYAVSLSTIDNVFAGTASFYAAPGVTSQYAYSLNGTTFTLIGSPVTTTSLTPPAVSLAGISALQNVPNGTTITLRYYASGQTTSGGWGYVSSTSTSNGLAIGGTVASTGASATLGNYSTQLSGNILQGAANVPLTGFTVTPNQSADFTGVTVTTSGSATTADLSNFRIFRDFNGDGIINAIGGTDAQVSTGTGAALSPSITFTIAGETGFATARNYLIVADVASNATSTVNDNIAASIANGAFTTSLATNTGSATGNVRTIVAPPGTTTITAGAGIEPTSISSLTNTQAAAVLNFDFTITDAGGDGLATQISQIVLNAGTGNTITDFSAAIAGAELNDGSNSTISATIGTSSITFPGITATAGALGNVADNSNKTYTLKIWLKNPLSAALKTTIDGLGFVFRVQTADLTVAGSGSQLATGQDVNSGTGNNIVDVTATMLSFAVQPTTTNVNAAMTPAVKVEAIDANGNRDLGFISTINITSTGTLTGSPVSATATSGLATFSTLTHTATGTGLMLTAASATPAFSVTSNAFDIIAAATLTELAVPQYFGSKSAASANVNRAPFAFVVKFDNLAPSTTYNLQSGLALVGEAATVSGAGNAYPNTGTTFSSQLIQNAFTTDAAGSSGPVYVYMEPTGNGTRFGPGQVHTLRLTPYVGSTVPSNSLFAGTKTLTALDIPATALQTAATTDDGAFIKIKTSADFSGKNVLVFDNAAGTGDPLSIYQIRNTSATTAAANATGFPATIADVYTQSGTSAIGDGGLVVPIGANNPNGVRRIEVRNANNTLFAAFTSTTGIWDATNTTTIARRDVQTITLLQGNVDNMEVNGSFSTTGNLAVNGNLIFTNGIVNTAANTITVNNTAPTAITGGSSTAYINGNLVRMQSPTPGDSYIYPIGSLTRFRPVRIANGATTSGNTFTVSYFPTAYSNVTPTNPANHVSTIEYWDIARTAGTATDPVDVSLITDNLAASGIANPTTVKVGHYNSATWDNLGGTAGTPAIAPAGTEITAAGIITFSPFTFISADASNPLPITIRDFTLQKLGNEAARLAWVIEKASGASSVVLERSVDGRQFQAITQVSGAQVFDGTYVDAAPANTGDVYYRLRMLDAGGRVSYSNTLTANYSYQNEVSLYPNPASDAAVLTWSDAASPALVIITNVYGQQVYASSFAGTNTALVHLTDFAVGDYLVTIKRGTSIAHLKLTVIR